MHNQYMIALRSLRLCEKTMYFISTTGHVHRFASTLIPQLNTDLSPPLKRHVGVATFAKDYGH